MLRRRSLWNGVSRPDFWSSWNCNGVIFSLGWFRPVPWARWKFHCEWHGIPTIHREWSWVSGEILRYCALGRWPFRCDLERWNPRNRVVFWWSLVFPLPVWVNFYWWNGHLLPVLVVRFQPRDFEVDKGSCCQAVVRILWGWLRHPRLPHRCGRSERRRWHRWCYCGICWWSLRHPRSYWQELVWVAPASGGLRPFRHWRVPRQWWLVSGSWSRCREEAGSGNSTWRSPRQRELPAHRPIWCLPPGLFCPPGIWPWQGTLSWNRSTRRPARWIH